MSFFVLGLPRSRTAWLANFLTHNGSFCYHEGLNGCRNLSEYKSKVYGCGDSSTGLTLIDLDLEFPRSPKVIIDRPPSFAIEWARKTFGCVNEELIEKMHEDMMRVSGLVVRYEDINDSLSDIWSHLIGGGYNEARAEQLKKMNVQVADPLDIDIEAAEELLSVVH